MQIGLRKTLRNQQGYFLVNLLVGSLVFLVTVMCIYKALPVLQRTVMDARLRLEAVEAAREKIEELKTGAAYLQSGTYGFEFEFHPKAQASYKISLINPYLIQLDALIVWGEAPGQQVRLCTLVRR